MDGAMLFAVDVSIISTGFYVSSSTKVHGIVFNFELILLTKDSVVIDADTPVNVLVEVIEELSGLETLIVPERGSHELIIGPIGEGDTEHDFTVGDGHACPRNDFKTGLETCPVAISFHFYLLHFGVFF